MLSASADGPDDAADPAALSPEARSKNESPDPPASISLARLSLERESDVPGL